MLGSIYNLWNGGYHVNRKLSYLFDWDYVESDSPSEKQKHLRHMVHRQILMSRVKLKPTKTKDKTTIKHIFTQEFEHGYIYDSEEETFEDF